MVGAPVGSDVEKVAQRQVRHGAALEVAEQIVDMRRKVHLKIP
jgi:hypothetical protein